MLQLVTVRLRKPTRIFTFLSRGVPVSVGDACIVRSDRGLEYGMCILPPADCSEEEAAEYPMTVVRKATYNDENNFRQLLVDEEKAKALCMGKVLERKLPMRLVNVEYTLDRHKVIFYFTADDRVDFRELVRDLAHELKTRIELRHIQVRDKSKLVGGLAACGRELCCSTWLPDFIPISMKMAKRQNLSLNPSKISGQCGRLMCCLGYEDRNYCDKKKRKPADEESPEKVGAVAEASDDEALVLDDDTELADLEPIEEDTMTEPGEAVYVVDPELGEVLNEPVRGGDRRADAVGRTRTEGGEKPDRPRRRPRRRRRRGDKPSGETKSAE